MAGPPVVNLYSVSSYTMGNKEPKTKKFTSREEHIAHKRQKYLKEKIMRTRVNGILLAQLNNHPHVLFLKPEPTVYQLPGGKLKPSENEIEGLERKLDINLAVNPPYQRPNWQIGDCVAVWWKSSFEGDYYPYLQPHIRMPKECKKLFIVHLPQQEYFSVPKNHDLAFVPFFDLYDNEQKYGHPISDIPLMLSRFHFNMIHSKNQCRL